MPMPMLLLVLTLLLLLLLFLRISLLAIAFAPAASESYANDVAVAPIGDIVVTNRGYCFSSTPKTYIGRCDGSKD